MTFLLWHCLLWKGFIVWNVYLLKKEKDDSAHQARIFVISGTRTFDLWQGNFLDGTKAKYQGIKAISGKKTAWSHEMVSEKCTSVVTLKPASALEFSNEILEEVGLTSSRLWSQKIGVYVLCEAKIWFWLVLIVVRNLSCIVSWTYVT